jgi:hypothetical protein
MVIGGNFLHVFATEMQLKVAKIEIDTGVPFRFRFPHFMGMQWYAAHYYFTKLSGTIELNKIFNYSFLNMNLNRSRNCASFCRPWPGSLLMVLWKKGREKPFGLKYLLRLKM